MVDHPRCEVVPLTPLHAEDGEAILAVLVLALLVRIGFRFGSVLRLRQG